METYTSITGVTTLKNDYLITLCAASFGVSESLIKSTSRQQNVKYARWCLWKLLREQGYSLKMCGEITGGFDHSSVLNAMRKLEDDIKKMPFVKNAWKHIVEQTSETYA